MSWSERVHQVLGDRATAADDVFAPVAVDVAPHGWVDALTAARDELGCTFFDWLSAVDELDAGFRLVCHVAARRPGAVDHLLVRTLLARDRPQVATAATVFAGARWHERETHEMFGIEFTEESEVLELEPLLLPAEFEGHPLRKEFVLASRVARPWPGAKEPGESDASPTPSRSRRKARPPGVPDPAQWGPRDA